MLTLCTDFIIRVCTPSLPCTHFTVRVCTPLTLCTILLSKGSSCNARVKKRRRAVLVVLPFVRDCTPSLPCTHFIIRVCTPLTLCTILLSKGSSCHARVKKRRRAVLAVLPFVRDCTLSLSCTHLCLEGCRCHAR